MRMGRSGGDGGLLFDDMTVGAEAFVALLEAVVGGKLFQAG